jgi:Kef-type K+ transport system membrane component KefB
MHRMRAIAFSVLTPFYFLKAGSLVAVKSLVTPMALTIVVGLLAVKMATKFIAVMPCTQAFRFGRRRGLYTTLLMSTGLAFGTISALYGFSHRYIDRQQYSWLVTVVILSAIIPTVIAERFFRPGEETPEGSKVGVPTAAPEGAGSEA